jgi:hypothetical protein
MRDTTYGWEMMAWEIEYTDQFDLVWQRLTEDEQQAISVRVKLLAVSGPDLKRPYVDVIKTSRYPNMKELIVPKGFSEFRVLFAFDPRRMALLLILGDKSTNDSTRPNWIDCYETFVPIADDIFTAHLSNLANEQT